jgi:hypothetical protein
VRDLLFEQRTQRSTHAIHPVTVQSVTRLLHFVSGWSMLIRRLGAPAPSWSRYSALHNHISRPTRDRPRPTPTRLVDRGDGNAAVVVVVEVPVLTFAMVWDTLERTRLCRPSTSACLWPQSPAGTRATASPAIIGMPGHA